MEFFKEFKGVYQCDCLISRGFSGILYKRSESGLKTDYEIGQSGTDRNFSNPEFALFLTNLV